MAIRASSGALRVWLAGLWERLLRISRRPSKQLRLCESLPLGERRFVAVVEFEKERFLVGGTSSSLVLLSRLEDSGEREEEGEERNRAGLRPDAGWCGSTAWSKADSNLAEANLGKENLGEAKNVERV